MTPHKAHLSHKGFTLLELIMVIALIALFLGLSAVAFSRGLPSSKFDALTRDVAASIRHARVLAQLRGGDVALTIDLEGRNFQVAGKPAKPIPSDVVVRINDPLAGEVTRGSHNVVFTPIGTSQGGTITLSRGSKVHQIHIDPLMGSVRVK